MTQMNTRYEKLKRVRSIEAQEREHFETIEEKADGAAALIQGPEASDGVALNSTVHVEDLDSGRHFVYTLVSSNAVDSAKNKVSAMAPLGRAILHRKSGDVVEFTAPAGLRRLRIKQVFDRLNHEYATPHPSETPRDKKQVA